MNSGFGTALLKALIETEPPAEAQVAEDEPRRRAVPEPPAEAAARAERQLLEVQAHDELLETVIRDHVRLVLQRTGGNKRSAAKRLGVDRRSLQRWLRRWESTRR